MTSLPAVRMRAAASPAATRLNCLVIFFDFALRGIPEVQALHTTNGRWDVVVELGVDSLEAFVPQRVVASPPSATLTPWLDRAGHHPITSNRNRRRRGRQLGHDPAPRSARAVGDIGPPAIRGSHVTTYLWPCSRVEPAPQEQT